MLSAAGFASDWPYGRGCYVSEDQTLFIWVGLEDHLRVMAMDKGAVLNRVFDRVKSCLDEVEEVSQTRFVMGLFSLLPLFLLAFRGSQAVMR